MRSPRRTESLALRRTAKTARRALYTRLPRDSNTPCWHCCCTRHSVARPCGKGGRREVNIWVGGEEGEWRTVEARCKQ